MLIVLEGIDKSGKGAQARLLLEALTDPKETHPYLNPLLIKFPRYDTAIGKMLRSHLRGYWEVLPNQLGIDKAKSEDMPGIFYDIEDLNIDAMAFQALMLADKALAAPDIEDRQRVKLTTILDRYWQSALAYGVADGLDEEALFRMHKVLPTANINILVDVPVDVAMARGRDGVPDEPDRYERDYEKLQRVRNNYLRLWAGEMSKTWSWHVIDGTRPPAEIHDRIMKLVPR